MREFSDKYLWGWIVILACLTLQLFMLVLAILDICFGILED